MGTLMDTKAYAMGHLLHLVLAGSRLHGTDTETSDYDWRGVCSVPRQVLLGLQKFDEYQWTDEKDEWVVYTLRRIFELGLRANPNILTIIFSPPQRWSLPSEPIWLRVYRNRRWFLSQRIRHTFRGYAFSQLRQIKGHREWLVNPPDHEPLPEEFGCYLYTDLKGGQHLDGKTYEGLGKFKAAQLRWQQYQTWLAERNPKRAELERKFGYDAKHASALVRLMLEGGNILREGDYDPVLRVDDQALVRQVLDGGWNYDRLVGFAEEREAALREMPSQLPNTPNFDGLQELLMELNEETLKDADRAVPNASGREVPKFGPRQFKVAVGPLSC